MIFILIFSFILLIVLLSFIIHVLIDIRRLFRNEFNTAQRTTYTHFSDDPKSKCDCRECWYMRGYRGGIKPYRV
jgi:hypothetical protein